MRVLTIRQPWAGLIVGSFQNSHGLLRGAEIRKWGTSYRGSLLIHAGVALDKEACERFHIDVSDCARGVIVGRVNVIGVVQIDSEQTWGALRYIHLEQGDRCYEDETFMWIFSDPILFRDPIPCTGKLGLWIPSQEIIGKIGLL